MLLTSRIKLSLPILIGVLLSILILKFSIEKHQMYETARLTEYAISEVQRFANKSVKKINVEHIKCLATNIYWEAGNEPFMGQVAVARVVMNRIKYGFGSNPCKVIYQTTTIPDLDKPEGVKKICQFSWVCENKDPPIRNANYLQAENIAKKVLLENAWRDDIPSNILFFHNNTVNPNWGYKQAMIIGNHIFYSKK